MPPVLGRKGKKGGELAVVLASGLEKSSQLVWQTGRGAATRDHPPLT